MVNKKFWATTFTLIGTIIGAGILGLPYVFSQSGFIIGLFWLILIGLILLFINLALGEIVLRTKSIHQLPGLAGKYLGKSSKKIMFFAVVFGIYSALVAYLIGEGQSFSKILPGNINPLILGFIFWIVMTLLLKEGIRGLKKIETWGVLAIIILIIIIFLNFIPSINLENLNHANPEKFFLPFGVILFALLGFTAIPELRREIKGQEKNLKKAIILGTLIPIILYALFAMTFVGTLGKKVPQIATLAFKNVFGDVITILGIFTMLTSYFVLSFSLKSVFKFDLRYPKKLIFFWVCLFPLIIYLIISIFNLAGFILVLGIGGAISGGLTGILILLMHKKIKQIKKPGRKAEYKIPTNWIIIVLLSIIFILGIIFEIVS